MTVSVVIPASQESEQQPRVIPAKAGNQNTNHASSLQVRNQNTNHASSLRRQGTSTTSTLSPLVIPPRQPCIPKVQYKINTIEFVIGLAEQFTMTATHVIMIPSDLAFIVWIELGMRSKIRIQLVPVIVGLSLLIAIFANVRAATGANSPVGYWLSYYKDTHQLQGIVKISAINKPAGKRELIGEVYTGWPHQDLKRNYLLCQNCPKPFTKQFIACMRIMWGYYRANIHPNVWLGGHIIDVFSGKIYRSKLQLSKNNKQLDVLGYKYGLHFIGRSQVWQRISQNQAIRYRRQAIEVWRKNILKNSDYYQSEIKYLEQKFAKKGIKTQKDMLSYIRCYK